MTLYLGLGKKVLGVFIALTSLFSHTPSTTDSNGQNQGGTYTHANYAAEYITAASPQFKDELPISMKPGYIPVYFNYPEKISIGAKRKIDYNFEKIFLYSLSGDSKKQQTSQDPQTSNNTSVRTPPIQATQTVTTNNVSGIEQTSLKNIERSIINIYCTIQNSNTIQAITGSGVIISASGLVLTNAHVGEYPLIANRIPSQKLSCEARTGSPVDQKYKIRVTYISKNWVEKNSGNISDPSFTESGEDDIALIQLIPTSKSFSNLSYIPLSPFRDPKVGDNISVSSYPADILGTLGISALLRVQTEPLSIIDVFSFTGNDKVDLIESEDSLHVQHGSSGGAITNSSGQLEAIIATIVGGNSPFTKHIRAITLNHISMVLKKDTGKNLEDTIDTSSGSIGQLPVAELDRLAKILINGWYIQQ